MGPATVLVTVTAPSLEVAERLVTTLVEERLAACGNILQGVTSIYRWQGRLERSDEVLILLKTVQASVQRLMVRVTELHPYEVPEVLAFTAAAGFAPYVSWVAANANG